MQHRWHTGASLLEDELAGILAASLDRTSSEHWEPGKMRPGALANKSGQARSSDNGS